MAQETRQIVQYRVRQGDSLEKLALRFMGDAESWLQVALLNALDYPYITDDSDFVRNVRATGIVVFTRVDGSTGDVPIPSGYVVTAPATPTSEAKDYRTTGSSAIFDGQATTEVEVEAVDPGEFGNTASLTITELSDPITDLDGVSNPEAVVGGENLNVKIPGDTLLVYSNQDGLAGTSSLDTLKLSEADFFASLLGVDIALGNDGDLQADSRGSYATSRGIDNFRAALLRRFGTPLAYYVFNPGYGTDVEKSIGQRGDSFWLQRTRVSAERTVRSDPRTQDVQNVQVSFERGALTISLDILAIGERDPRNLVVTFQVGV